MIKSGIMPTLPASTTALLVFDWNPFRISIGTFTINCRMGFLFCPSCTNIQFEEGSADIWNIFHEQYSIEQTGKI